MATVKYGRGLEKDLEDVMKNNIGAGWHQIVRDLVDDIYKLGWDGQLFQLKEKFGGLRFYIGAAPHAVHERIAQAESASDKTCEECGEPGKLRQGAWLQTLCDAHALGRKSFEEEEKELPFTTMKVFVPNEES